jgi:hypothetical protein
MAGLFDRAITAISSARGLSSAPRGAFSEFGVGGTIAYGGQIANGDRNPNARGPRRWQTAQETLVNISVVAAGVRYYLNLTARPKWKLVPPDDSPAAKDAAEFAESLLHSTDTSWTRIVRRNALFKFHGFGMHEWVAKRRDDGKIGFRSIEPRPPHTIEKWDMDGHNSVLGVWQRNPGNGSPIYLPREKLIYLVDDSLTDSPEGMGWSRHLIEPADRLRKYLKLEKIGYERDLQGTPIGRAPYAAIRAAVAAGTITEAAGKELTQGIEDFVRTKSKEPDTGLMVDSQPFVGKSEQGATISTALQYGIDLLTGEAGSIDKLGTAIGRTTWDMALIMGVERLLVGREGAGSLALSTDTSQNLFLNINSTLGDMAESYDRDLIGPAWALNGFDPKLRPTLQVEDAAFKDVEALGKLLADMASAGAILAPDDPAINDIRALAGLPDQPEMTPERMGMLMPPPPSSKPLDNPDPDPTDPGNTK